MPRWRQRLPSRAALPTTSRSSGQPPTYAKLRRPSARAYMVLLRSPPPLNSQAADRVVLLQHGCEGCCLRAHLRRLGRSCGARSARSHGGKAERCQSNQARAGTSTVASSRSLAFRQCPPLSHRTVISAHCVGHGLVPYRRVLGMRACPPSTVV